MACLKPPTAPCTPLNQVDGLVKRRVGATGLKFVRAHLAQQLFKRVDHGQAERDAHGAAKRHFEAGVHVMRVFVVVRDDGDVAVPGVVERLAQ